MVSGNLLDPSNRNLVYFGKKEDPIGLLVTKNYEDLQEGIKFFSDANWNFQIGYMHRRRGHVIPEHIHNNIERTIQGTQEVLIVRRGSCIIELYDDLEPSNSRIIYKVELKSGDIILLRKGGHKITIEQDCEILEIKQGPYLGNSDKRKSN